MRNKTREEDQASHLAIVIFIALIVGVMLLSSCNSYKSAYNCSAYDQCKTYNVKR